MLASIYGIGIALVRRDKRFVARDYARQLARGLDAAFGIRVRITGQENLRRVRPCIYISNHQNLLDVPVLARLYPEDTVMIGKEALRRIPLFGWLFQVTGSVFIDRSDRNQAVGRLKNAEATGVPLVPTVVAPLRRLWDLRRGCIRSDEVEVQVLETLEEMAARQS